MKFVALSGVFALASAGLAFASIGPSDPVKTATAPMVPVVEVDAAPIDKKEADSGDITVVSADCTDDPDLSICAEAATKN